jgi:hypothetical protein
MEFPALKEIADTKDFVNSAGSGLQRIVGKC